VNYGLWGDDSFNVRSPHSIFFTMFGRLGFAGLLALLALSSAMVGEILEVTRNIRQDRRRLGRADLAALGWLSVAWVVFISSWFGVVLEGPMGAVIFWSALGIGNAERIRLAEQAEVEIAAAGEASPQTLESAGPVKQ
jgi:O-antigen ligase